jgi:hypothetical protein
MWQIQLAFRFLISCRIFLCSLTSWFHYKEICYDARSHERKQVKKKQEYLVKLLHVVLSYFNLGWLNYRNESLNWLARLTRET